MSSHHFKSVGHPYYTCQNEGGYTYQPLLDAMRKANLVSMHGNYTLEECYTCREKSMMNYDNYEKWSDAGVEKEGFFCDLTSCQRAQKLVRGRR